MTVKNAIKTIEYCSKERSIAAFQVFFEICAEEGLIPKAKIFNSVMRSEESGINFCDIMINFKSWDGAVISCLNVAPYLAAEWVKPLILSKIYTALDNISEQGKSLSVLSYDILSLNREDLPSSVLIVNLFGDWENVVDLCYERATKQFNNHFKKTIEKFKITTENNSCPSPTTLFAKAGLATPRYASNHRRPDPLL